MKAYTRTSLPVNKLMSSPEGDDNNNKYNIVESEQTPISYT
jgi:hypothetical protein